MTDQMIGFLSWLVWLSFFRSVLCFVRNAGERSTKQSKGHKRKRNPKGASCNVENAWRDR